MAFSKSVIILVWCVSCCFFIENAVGKNINNLKKVILEEIISHDEIDVLLPPSNLTGGPITVEIFVHLINIDEINEEKRESKFTFLLRQKWTDPRLKYESQNLFDYILVPNVHLIWTPDLYLTGAKKSVAYEVPNPNAFVRVYPNATVVSSKRITLTRNCPLNLKNFPFDLQVAQLTFSTYGSTTDDIMLKWTDDKPLTISKNINLHFLTLQQFLLTSKISKVSATGNYSVLQIDFFLKRELSHYLIHVYIPTAMLVIVSWFAFWLNRKLLIARLLINLLALVTLTLTVSDLNRNVPKMSYNRSLDYFTGISLTFIMLSFVETILVHVLHNETESSEDKHLNGDIQKKKVEKSKLQCLITKLSEKVNYIDVGGRILYPVSYLLFCVVHFAINVHSD